MLDSKMQSLLACASRRHGTTLTIPLCRASSASTSRTFSTRRTKELAINAADARIRRHAQSSFDTSIRIARRSYWWSSKPSAPTTTPADGSSLNTTSSTESGAAKTIEASTVASPAKDTVESISPASSPTALATTETPVAAPESLSDATSTATSSTLSTGDLPLVPSSEAQDILSSLQSVTSEYAIIAASDYSHLFSWVWPAGLFLRTYSFITAHTAITSPLIAFAVAHLILRAPILPMQIRAQKSSARFAPYQDEWFGIQEKYRAALADGDQLKAGMLAQRMMEIKNKTEMKPFAPLLPAFGLTALGIGGFIGAGRLVQYHKEVVEMGGVGPLNYPGGLFGTGLFEDLTAFSPSLLVLMTAMTWLSARRGALDAPKPTKWTARFPWLMTPPALIFGAAIQFSAAQMIIATTSIGFNVLQSYVLRIPRVRAFLGMEQVPVQDAKTYEFPGPIKTWKDTFNDWRKHTEDQAMRARDEKLKTMERQRLLMSRIAPGRRFTEDAALDREMRVDKDHLRVKDAPAKKIKSPSPPAPEPIAPTGFFAEDADAAKTIFGSSEAGRRLPTSVTGPPKPSSSPKAQGKKVRK